MNITSPTIINYAIEITNILPPNSSNSNFVAPQKKNDRKMKAIIP